MPDHNLKPEAQQFLKDFTTNLAHHQGTTLDYATRNDLYLALAFTVRDRLIERWLEAVKSMDRLDSKVVHYFSAEYLLGQQLENNLFALGLTETAQQALQSIGFNLEELADLEAEPGLGNGGLGRLAACYLNSLATLSVPAIGYGIRYEFGIFRQVFHNGWQVEQPDDWLRRGDPWEIPDPDGQVTVGFGGRTHGFTEPNGRYRVAWTPEWRVMGMPYNLLVPGYKVQTVNALRLWSARATKSFDLQVFNTGDYTRAVEQKTFSENISMVLYPDDTNLSGKTLRLQQQYFFVACSLADILRTYRQRYATGWDDLPDKAAIQLNDTHPSIAVAELMRLLVDIHQLPWEQAWEITRRMFGYTLHTLMPEALEEWPVSVFQSLLPRHLEIIYEINHRFLQDVHRRFPRDTERQVRMSLIRETPEKSVRMAHLAALGSFSINGVAELQSYLLRENTLRDFYEMYPERFGNKTNGVTPRRFLGIANPRLSHLISTRIGDGWLTNLTELRRIENFIDDPAFTAEWRQIKQANKQDLAAHIRTTTGIDIDPASLYDVMVKRLHEYKRQLLKLLHTLTIYYRLKDSPKNRLTPRTVIFGAKAAPGYQMAKLIIKLINNAAEVVNNDPQTNDWLRMVFVPNFNVTIAQRIYPAADLSEQISLAGKEASGTGNMKFAMNGAVTIGTMDGANIEIRQLVGAQNFFLFGLTADEVATRLKNGYHPREIYQHNPELRRILDAVRDDAFSPHEPGLFKPIVNSLLAKDEYLLLADYQSYIDTQDTAVRAYLDPELWTRMSILNTARSGFFSSDRAIEQYCEEIWKIRPGTALPVG